MTCTAQPRTAAEVLAHIQRCEEAIRNAKSEVDLATAQAELAVLAAQLAAGVWLAGNSGLV